MYLSKQSLTQVYHISKNHAAIVANYACVKFQRQVLKFCQGHYGKKEKAYFRRVFTLA